MNVALLGPDIAHRESLIEMLSGQDSRVCWVPDSLTFHARGKSGKRRRLDRFANQILGTRDAEYLRHVTRVLDESDARVVIAYWGTLPLADLAAIRRVRPDLRLVLMVLCYPLAFSAAGVYRQKFYMRRALRFLDGMLYPSEEMANYFGERVFAGSAPPAMVLPPCWPSSFQSRVRRPCSEPSPNLVYAGRTDLSARTIHEGDDIRPLMHQLLEAGINLHHVYSPETDDGHPRRKPFQPLPLHQLIEFMGAFDASLVAYNTEVCRRDDRFQLTVPDRLITSVSAGIPIAVPSRGYSGAKSYLREYPALIEFDSAEDLANTLVNQPHINNLRDAAWNSRQAYAAIRHSDKLRRFLATLV